MPTNFSVEFDREADGRWIADIPELPGAMAYGLSREEACANAQAIALRILADRIEESKEAAQSFSFANCA